MNNEQRKKLLCLLADLQKDCSDIKLTIGDVDKGMVSNEEIVLISAPPAVINALQSRGYNLNLEEGKLYVGRLLGDD